MKMETGAIKAQKIRKNDRMIRSGNTLSRRLVKAKTITVKMALITSIKGMDSGPYRFRKAVSTKFLKIAVTKKRKKQTIDIHTSF